jgi:hypothetical protein
MASAQIDSLDSLESILQSDEWYNLKDQLLEYVEDFQYKVVQARTGFQL